jgi:hypothetical protein
MQINASLSAIGNLLALIQESNPKFGSVTEDQLSVVSVAAQAADAQGRNAVATVSLAGYQDTAAFQYTRLSLTDNVVNPSLSLSVDPATMKAADVHAAVIGALALLDSEVKISSDAFAEDGSLVAPAEGQSASVTIAANANSVLYADGATVAVSLVFPAPAAPVVPSVGTLVDNAALNGFNPAQAPAEQPAAPTDTPAAPAADGQAPAEQPADQPAADTTVTSTTTTTIPADGTQPTTETETTVATGDQPAQPAADAPAADTQPASTEPVAETPAATDGQPAAPAADETQTPAA